MRIDPDTCRDPVLLSAEVRRLQAVIAAGEPTLTDAEREAVERAAEWLVALAATRNEIQAAGYLVGDAATLRGLLERTKEAAIMSDTNERSVASDGSAIPGQAIERAFRDLANKANEASRAHAMNYVGLIYALLLKGVISPEELEAGRERARAVVDEHFGPTPEQEQAENLARLIEAFRGRKA